MCTSLLVASDRRARPEVGKKTVEIRSENIFGFGKISNRRLQVFMIAVSGLLLLETREISASKTRNQVHLQYTRLARSATRQDVAGLPPSPSPGRHLDPTDSSGWLEVGWPKEAGNGEGGDKQQSQEKSSGQVLDELLESLPVLSVGQKHAATFECELNKEDAAKQLVWLRLNRDRSQANSAENEISLLSLNQKLITPDKRFKVRRQSQLKWSLTLEQVAPDDGHAYYLCQAGAASSGSGPASCAEAGASESCKRPRPASRFVGGARLNVLAPPRIVELETSPSLVHAEEYEPLVLRCKVVGEPQSQLMWKREDGQPLGGQTGAIEQRFKHEIERRPSQILSIDSSELSFDPYFTRNQAGAYHCIASNGVQPGVSQRINVVATKCRASANDLASSGEPCDQPATQTSTDLPVQTSTNRARAWRTGSNQRVPQTSVANAQSDSTKPSRNRQLFGPSDKRRTRNNNTEIPIIDQGQRAAASSGSCGRLISITYAIMAQIGIAATIIAQAQFRKEGGEFGSTSSKLVSKPCIACNNLLLGVNWKGDRAGKQIDFGKLRTNIASLKQTEVNWAPDKKREMRASFINFRFDHIHQPWLS